MPDAAGGRGTAGVGRIVPDDCSRFSLEKIKSGDDILRHF
jgi:hypothetical protein